MFFLTAILAVLGLYLRSNAKDKVQDAQDALAQARQDEADLYHSVARLAPELMRQERKMYKPVSPNIDFYSGFAYNMLNIPDEFITPLFAIARIAGWSAHRIEELTSAGKIIRPAYKSVSDDVVYTPLSDR